MVKLVETWDMADIGSVSVLVSDRARRVRITVKRDGTINLTLPRRVPIEQGRQLLETKKPWIRKHLHAFGSDERSPGPRVDWARAKETLTERLRHLAQVHHFTYNRVFLRNQRTRWGSCSDKNNINLNVNLLHLPEELRDYVLLHELVHTRVKNHGKEFWRALDAIVGDGKALQKQLRRYRLSV